MSDKRKIPAVRLDRVPGRAIRLRYTDPVTKQDIRISTETTDEAAALEQKRQLEAKLTLGIEVAPRRSKAGDGPRMPWEEFRDDYSRLKVATFRSDLAKNQAECNIDVCENVIKPRTLGDMAKPSSLARLQSELLAGACSPRKKARSPHTVRSYMGTLIAALNWAHRPMHWLPESVDFKLLDCDDPDKGRPITLEEFERMLAAVPKVIDDPQDEPGWKYLLRGLWESGLRLREALSVAWDIDGMIVPTFHRKGLPTLHIPAKLQKSRKAQDVPTTPGFAALLEETPAERRKGFIFNPGPRRGTERLCVTQVGRIIASIGEAAHVVVNAAGKSASAHDLRRSFAQRMANAGIAPRDLQAIMRHSSLATTEAYYLREQVQDQGARIAACLGTLPNQETKNATVADGVSR